MWTANSRLVQIGLMMFDYGYSWDEWYDEHRLQQIGVDWSDDVRLWLFIGGVV